MPTTLSTRDLERALSEEITERYPSPNQWNYSYVIDTLQAENLVIFSANGSIWQQEYSIDDSGDVTLIGTAVECEARTVYEPVEMNAFSAAFADNADGDLIYEGEIFRSGIYADKGTTADPSDLIAMATRFKGATRLKVQHVDSAFDEAFEGYGLERMEARDGGKWLWGRARLPGWLKKALGSKFKVSVGVDLVDGHPVQINELSIVDVPRVDTAELAEAVAAFAGARNSSKDAQRIQKAHDLMCELGAACPSAAMSSSRQNDKPGKGKEGKMNPLEKLLAFFRAKPEIATEAGLTEADIATFGAPVVPAATAQALSPEVAAAVAAQSAQFAALQAQVDGQHMVILNSRAEAFADDVIRIQGKALPAEREQLKALFVMAAKADGKDGKASFAVESGDLDEGANVKVLKDSIAARTKLGIFGATQIPDRPMTEKQSERVGQAIAAGGVEAYNRRR